jgi:glycerol-3-phosphate dehydrogenase
VRYLIDHEFARDAADILWRRSKLGLHLNEKDQAALGDFVARALGREAPLYSSNGATSSHRAAISSQASSI